MKYYIGAVALCLATCVLALFLGKATVLEFRTVDALEAQERRIRSVDLPYANIAFDSLQHIYDIYCAGEGIRCIHNDPRKINAATGLPEPHEEGQVLLGRLTQGDIKRTRLKNLLEQTKRDRIDRHEAALTFLLIGLLGASVLFTSMLIGKGREQKRLALPPHEIARCELETLKKERLELDLQASKVADQAKVLDDKIDALEAQLQAPNYREPDLSVGPDAL